MENTDLRLLEIKIDELIAVCNKLVEENRQLREQQTSLIAERDALREKTKQARNRIESMIDRLKAIEAEG